MNKKTICILGIIYVLLIITTSIYFVEQYKCKRTEETCKEEIISYQKERKENDEISSVEESLLPTRYSYYIKVKDYKITDELYCILGITDNEYITVPYHKDTGCIYTEKVCEQLLKEDTTILNADLNKCK